MSAYAALVSLQQTLATILDRGGRRILRIRGELRSLHETVISLLDFLEKSSTASQVSEQETKMREAAYKAEDLIEFEICVDLDSDSSRSFHNLMRITFRDFIYAVVVSLMVSSGEVIPVWVQIFMVHRLAAVAICTIYNVVIHLALPDLNDLKAEELRRVSHYLSTIVVEIKGAGGDREMLDCAELKLLQKTLDSVLDSGSGLTPHGRAQLKALHEKVCVFLGNASTYTSMPQNLDAKIKAAASHAKAVIEFQFAAQFIQVSNWIKFCVLMEISLLASLSNLPALALFTIIMLTFINYELLFATSSHVIRVCTQHLLRWFIAIALGFGALVLGTGGAEVVFLVLATANNNSEAQENQELSFVIDSLINIISEVDQIMDPCGNPSRDLPAASSGWDSGGTGNDNVVVGLESEIQDIKTLLLEESSQLHVISIVGMGGIGKTTLASQVYNDPDFAHHFDVRAWVTVSEECSPRPLLLRLLDSVKILTKQMQKENEESLGEHLFKYLKYRRFLIVMDDLWGRNIWHSVRRFLPDDFKGSRVLLTSRLSDVASDTDSGSPLHQMQCLNEEESWNLLCGKVFGAQGCCPEELESVGREIARDCKGLPLAIVVIGGVLSKDKQPIIWGDVAEKIRNSQMMQINEQCLEILGLSYNHLPHHLRPCFLYMAVFSVDSEIPVSKLISLWAAEGFLKPCTSKNIEEVAEDYLKDLVERNLVLVCKRSYNYGKMRTCSIHNLLRDVCVENARKENFLHFVDSGPYVTRERPYALQVNPRRELLSCDKYVRSFLCIASKSIKEPSIGFIDFPYLRVLDILVVHFEAFPDQVIELVSLRYLALSYDGPLPQSMSKLQYLETLVHHHCSFHKYPLLPPVIWNMQSLRHLYVKPGCYLSDPLGYRLPWNSTVLEHLQTLVGIRNFRWSKGIIKRIPNLKKLGVSYDDPPSGDWSEYELESLVKLHQLEILKIRYDGSGSAKIPKLEFPQKLKKLSLSGIHWTSIGALPNLEALKLRWEACSGPSWETVEGEFPQLTYLLLEQVNFRWWETDEAHFPCLRRLVLRSCDKLQEIPSAIGEISTLEMIELVDCLPSAVNSAKLIQKAQDREGHEVGISL